MNLKHFTIFIMFLLVSFNTFGQSGILMSVYGKVIDVNTNTPMKDLKITLFLQEKGEISDAKIARTNSEGIYKIRYLKEGQYSYLLEIPNIGVVTIGGYDEKNCYEFELKEGQNLNLNFFVGSSKIPDIKKEFNKSLNIVNITFLYPVSFLEPDETSTDNGNLLKSSSGCRLIVKNENDSPVEIDDAIVLPNDAYGKPAGGRFLPLYNYRASRPDCENKKCKIDSIVLTIGGTIEMHKPTWFEARYGENYKDGIGNCLYDCILQHEMRHRQDAIKYAKDSFCNIMRKIDNVSAKCECEFLSDTQIYSFKCPYELGKIYKKMVDDFNEYMDITSEKNAYGISDPCAIKCFNEYKKEVTK